MTPPLAHALALFLFAATLETGCDHGRSGIRDHLDGSTPAAISPSLDALVASYRAAVVAGANVNEARRALASRGDDAVPAALRMLVDPDARVGEQGEALLEAIGTPRALEAFVDDAVRRVESEDKERRSPPSYERIKRMGRPLVPVLLAKLRADPSRYAHSWIVGAARDVDDPSAGAIFEIAAADPEWRVAGPAATWLGKFPTPAACRILLALARSPDVYRQASAVRGLRLLGDPSAVAPLVEIANGPDEFIPSNPYVARGEGSPKAEAKLAIETIVGKEIAGDPAKLRDWIRAHPPSGGCAG